MLLGRSGRAASSAGGSWGKEGLFRKLCLCPAKDLQ